MSSNFFNPSSVVYNLYGRSAGQLSGIALRDVTGRYLTAVGRDAVVQSRNRTAGKDEIFVAEHSQPQVFFTAHNGRMISTRQGRFTATLHRLQPTLTRRENMEPT